VADSSSRIDQAAALHRQAEAVAEAAGVALESLAPAVADPREQHRLAEELRAAAGALAVTDHAARWAASAALSAGGHRPAVG
jgi:S-DNA-T family DNA segregation ATPase FtsK/SpoIIIE